MLNISVTLIKPLMHYSQDNVTLFLEEQLLFYTPNQMAKYTMCAFT